MLLEILVASNREHSQSAIEKQGLMWPVPITSEQLVLSFGLEKLPHQCDPLSESLRLLSATPGGATPPASRSGPQSVRRKAERIEHRMTNQTRDKLSSASDS